MGLLTALCAWIKPPAIKPAIIRPIQAVGPFAPPIPACGLELIKQVEGCRLQAYLDEKSIPTIGFGHTEGVYMGQECTQDEADVWLSEDALSAWNTILGLVRVPITQNRGGALLSFCYNIGNNAFRNSTLLHILNSGDYEGVGDQMLRWVWEVKPDGTKKISEGLLNRRKSEVALWEKT